MRFFIIWGAMIFFEAAFIVALPACRSVFIFVFTATRKLIYSFKLFTFCASTHSSVRTKSIKIQFLSLGRQVSKSLRPLHVLEIPVVVDPPSFGVEAPVHRLESL